MIGRRVRRIGLGAFFVSVSANAVLGIYAVLAPEFGETQAKILGSSLCVTAAVLLGLACEPAWERRVLGSVPWVGAVLGVLGFGLVIAALWAEPESEVLWKAMGSILTVAAACAVASLLALAQLVPGHRWVLAVTFALLALGAGLVATTPWIGNEPHEWYLRVMGVTLIALAAFAVSVPVLHRVDRSAYRLAWCVGQAGPVVGTLIVLTVVAVVGLMLLSRSVLTTECGGFSCGAGSSVSNAPG